MERLTYKRRSDSLAAYLNSHPTSSQHMQRHPHYLAPDLPLASPILREEWTMERAQYLPHTQPQDGTELATSSQAHQTLRLASRQSLAMLSHCQTPDLLCPHLHTEPFRHDSSFRNSTTMINQHQCIASNRTMAINPFCNQCTHRSTLSKLLRQLILHIRHIHLHTTIHFKIWDTSVFHDLTSRM